MSGELKRIKQAWGSFLDLFEDDPPSDEPVYDPVHVAGIVVGCLTLLGVFYWILWALLVCEGGIFTKIIPFFQVLFTSKTLQDFGYKGYPYQLGIFEGWIINVAALVLLAAGCILMWWIFDVTDPGRKKSGDAWEVSLGTAKAWRLYEENETFTEEKIKKENLRKT